MNPSKRVVSLRSEAAKAVVAWTLVVAAFGPRAWARAQTVVPKQDPNVVQTFYFKNGDQQREAEEVYKALRDLLDARDKVVFLPSQNAVSVSASPDQLLLAQKILNDLDRPKQAYRLTYTISEMDSGKRIGVQHFAMIVAGGGRTTLKNGSRVPIATVGSASGPSIAQSSQVTYIEVGLSIDATLDEFTTGARLRTKVEQSSVAEERSGLGAQDPIVRQTTIEGTSFLTPGKPLVLGSVDVSGSTRHLDVEVVMEAVR